MSKEHGTENKAGRLKGLKIRTLSLWIVVGTILVSVLIGDGVINVMDRYQELANMTKKYIVSEEAVMDMAVGSNYLTEQARLYAMTKERSHADAYFTEVDVTQRREKSLEQIEAHLPTTDTEALRMSKDALRLSNELMDLEIHSMKLAAQSAGEDLSKLSPKIQEYSLPTREKNYTDQEKADLACQLVFGHEYQDMKQQIEQKLSGVTDHVISICDREQKKSEKAMKNALTRQILYTILVVGLVILSYAMIAALILRPIKIYVNCIKNNNFLEITGAYEFKYLAATYNNVYEMSLAQQNMLRQKAERDALTGLLNRQAFEQLKEQLHNVPKPIALLLIDVDIFKSINDTYGHDMGDQALIKVANLLASNFRRADYVIRIGGDEFAVIMEKIRADKEQIVSYKLDEINWALQHPQEENFPKLSISVGVAFSEQGYHDDLFRQADQALYKTKENGRCGHTFYRPNES
ncbi:MAG: GGDEF domain-containing protein [Firmicutes bacterium]|nr:GGDEF domain-containing protein [Bacillota bacterium]NBI64231.1 GGDEF domain-containing protein [Clostridiales bacterium]